MTETPYVGFSNETLRKCRPVKPGDKIHCPSCHQEHELVTADDGSALLLFYKCGNTSYLGAINGRCTIETAADCSGKI